MENEIKLIKENGFESVKWYDEDLKYSYYDACLNGIKVEVRIGIEKKKMEWRYLGTQDIENIEWFALNINEMVEEIEEIEEIEETDTNEAELEASLIQSVVENVEIENILEVEQINLFEEQKEDEMQVNIVVNI